jgi:hypothetical protein
VFLWRILNIPDQSSMSLHIRTNQIYTIYVDRTAIRAVQSQYVQQREYGSVPSFSRSHRVGATSEDSADSENIYHVLPADLSEANSIHKVKTKLENLHPSQRDYVSAQLVDQVCPPECTT